MRIKITPTTAASKRPASPSGDSDDSSATQSAKKRRVRRPALSNDEDMAILRAVITLQPYRALWGQGRLKWQEAADHVAQQTGGEMSDELCKGRYVNLLKRYTTPQEDRKRPWPKDEQLKQLLEEALVLQTKWEEEVKDEVEEKPTHRRKWQPLQALGKLPSSAETATSSETRTQTTAGEGAGENAPSAPRTANATSTTNAGASTAPAATTAPQPRSSADQNPPPPAARPTRWTAPAPGARAPVLATATPVIPTVQTPVASAGSPANPQAAALASRAVASATRAPAPAASSASKGPSQAPPASSITSSRPPPTASQPSSSATTPVPSSTATATSSPAVATYVSTSTTRTSVTASVLTSTTRTSAPAPAPVPASGAASRALPTPAPWLASSRSMKPENTRFPGLNQRAPTPTSTPPRESKPQGTKTTPPPSATPPSTTPTVAGRGSSVRAMPVQEIVQTTMDQHGRPAGSARVTTSRQPGSTPSTSSSTPASANVSSSSSSSSSTVTTSRPMPPQRGFPAPTSQYSHVRLNGSSLAPQGPSQARYIPLANAPFPMPVSTHSTRTSTSTLARERESSPRTQVNNQTQPPHTQAASGARIEPANAASQPRTPDHTQGQGYAHARSMDAPRATTLPHGQAPTSIESTLFVVLDRLTAMENARLADTREERELKRRQLEMEEAQQHNNNNSNSNNTSNSALPSPSRGNRFHPHELEELRRTLTTSLATSRQQQIDLQMEVGRLVPALQAGQRERGQLQVEILSLTTQLKGVQRERDELKQDLTAVIKTMKQVQLAMQRQEDAFEDYKKADAMHRKREMDAQQATLTRQLEQFQDALQVDRRKREELLLSIQKEREYNQAQHRERLRELDVRAAALGDRRGGLPETTTTTTQQRPSRVEAELAELRIAIDVERSEREREYTTLLQNIKQIIAGDESA